jgi:hypothetical protein
MEVNATPLPGEGGWGNPPPSIPTPVSSTLRKYHFAFTSGNDVSRSFNGLLADALAFDVE